MESGVTWGWPGAESTPARTMCGTGSMVALLLWAARTALKVQRDRGPTRGLAAAWVTVDGRDTVGFADGGEGELGGEAVQQTITCIQN
jgi:hypothetical protein